ncbi:hypothetical protein RRV45_11200 [Bacillus sp. DTU_2020_1000418_1_SI_GHA_SEK_038]|uniref:hypothetical protein n=1 Tax=Bacillus sp. DTU_2020_1000418_1_SI_GHA_SEK_038 TaxID=3077585 RepID=UPI0028EAD148|nr:hypothetical protein [Bacillus sp. DTU_2020_1000418_1_SI_GHA_SEK_038]WNS73494.1 hypothetical protein RRV45_11200 [Bacillus sp. DTU_2020_1000418_1_SI_GHA_SEK_038]
MGLYTNSQIVPNLYNKKPQIDNQSNQDSYRLNYLQEILNEQKLVNNQLTDTYEKMDVQISESLKGVHHNIERTSSKHNKDLVRLMDRLEKQEKVIIQFLEAIKAQEAANQIIIERLDELEGRNAIILENMEKESLINQAVLDQVSFQHASTEALIGKIDQFQSFSYDLTNQLNKQEAIYDELSRKLEVHEVFHKTVMERLDGQEAVVQKISRQIENLRSTLYERASFLSEKIETSFKQLLKPVQSYFIQTEKEKNKN